MYLIIRVTTQVRERERDKSRSTKRFSLSVETRVPEHLFRGGFACYLQVETRWALSLANTFAVVKLSRVSGPLCAERVASEEASIKCTSRRREIMFLNLGLSFFSFFFSRAN